MQILKLVLSALLSVSTVVTPLVDEFQKVGRERQAQIDGPDLPGFAYAVTDKGQITEMGGAGVKKLGETEPIAPDTPFLIGSISKSFTALAIMQLVESGKISLDAPAATYLPPLVNTAAGRITVRHLLNHTSGFSQAQGNRTQTDLSEDGAALARRVKGLATVIPAAQPGKRFEYSNANYQLLGRMIETVSGTTYANYIETNIFAPAGMPDSFVHPGPRSAHVATGHRFWFGNFRPDEKNLTGAGSGPQGGVASSARDMARYLGLMMNGRSDILSAEGKEKMMRSDDPVAPSYGFGWNIAPDGRVWHAGSNPGYDAIATMLPEQRKGTIVLVNALGGSAFGQTVPLRLQITKETLGIDGIRAPDPTLMRVVMIALVIASLAFANGIFQLWRKRRPRKVKKGWRAVLALVLPLLATIAFAFAALITMPGAYGGSLGAAWLFAPDLTILLLIASTFALAWGISRTAMLLRPQFGA